MFRSQPNHYIDYFILLTTLAFSAIAVRTFHFTKSTLALITLAVSLAYVFWGIFHHKKAGHIDQKIVLEYFGLALLVNIIIATLVF